MPKRKLSETKKVDLLNIQIKFILKLQSGSYITRHFQNLSSNLWSMLWYYSSFMSTSVSTLSLSLSSLQQSTHKHISVHNMFFFIHASKAGTTCLAFTYAYFNNGLRNRKIFFVLYSYDFSDEFHLQANSLGSVKTSDGKWAGFHTKLV